MAYFRTESVDDSEHFLKISSVGTSVDITQYLPSNVWSKLTVDNFAVETSGAGGSWNTGAIADSSGFYASFGYSAISKSYNAETGILTLNRPSASIDLHSNNQSYWNTTSYCTKTLYVFW